MGSPLAQGAPPQGSVPGEMSASHRTGEHTEALSYELAPNHKTGAWGNQTETRPMWLRLGVGLLPPLQGIRVLFIP